MKKKQPKTTQKSSHPTRYPKEIQLECVNLLKQGLSVVEVIDKMNGPKERAIKRYAKKFNFEIKN